MIKVSVQPTIYSDIIKSMQIDNLPWTAPRGLYYLLSGDIVPFTPQPTVLRIETDRIGEPINIRVQPPDVTGNQVDVRANQTSYTVVAASEVVTTGVQLGRGKNRITVSVANRENEVAYLIVNATTITALFEAFSRVIFNESFNIIEEQQRAISSALATRLIEPFINFQDLLPDIQSLQILATRLVTKGLIHSVGSELGVKELLKAISLTTPIYKPIDKDTFDVYPALDPWTRTGAQFGSLEAHVWLPNVGITSWLAFIHYVSNQPDLFEIVKITEQQVVVNFQGQQQRHFFDFDAFGTDFLTVLAASECFKSIIINVSMDVNVTFPICAASYTFDLFITEDGLLGDCRTTLDSGTPFDSNCPFDLDPIDPFSDGWLGLSLTGRFEQDYPNLYGLDTFVVPSTTYTGDTCVYPGYYTQQVSNHKYEPEIDATTFDVQGYIQAGIGWVLESPDGTRWRIKVNPDASALVAISGAPINPTNFKLAKPDTSEAAFAITNAGELQVVSPPPGGEILRDNIFILGTDSTVWEVTVSNANELEITKIFPI